MSIFVHGQDSIRPYQQRIRQLEEQLVTLTAEVSRMRPLCDTAIAYRHGDVSEFTLQNVIADYERERKRNLVDG